MAKLPLISLYDFEHRLCLWFTGELLNLCMSVFPTHVKHAPRRLVERIRSAPLHLPLYYQPVLLQLHGCFPASPHPTIRSSQAEFGWGIVGKAACIGCATTRSGKTGQDPLQAKAQTTLTVFQGVQDRGYGRGPVCNQSRPKGQWQRESGLGGPVPCRRAL